MTAPLSGKLPEFPDIDSRASVDDWWKYWKRMSDAWEVRTRLAAEALQAIERNDLEDNPLTLKQLCDFARDTLHDLGPLPKESP